MRYTVSDLETSARCTQEGQALIAFAVPNPNPASDLTDPHTTRSSGHGFQPVWPSAWPMCGPDSL